MAVDKTDEKIIELLKKDGRMPFVNIAKKLKTSEGTIRARVKRMINDRVIHGFTVRTSGKNVKAFIEVKIDVNINTSEISGKIKRMPGVDAVYEVSGENDIICLIDVMSTKELNSIIENIRRLEHTAATKTRLVLKEV
jgi:DNA-binding Lrp family transcriptional regulator